MTDEEARNLAFSERWERLYHEDVGRMCDECYASDCEVVVMATGETIRSRDSLKAGELALRAAAPDRSLRSFNRIAKGNQVLVELTWEGTHTGDGLGVPATGKHWSVRACAVQTFRDGLIVQERAYGEIMMQYQLGIWPQPEQGR